MADAPWQWDPKTRRYRERATGRFLSLSQLAPLRDQFADQRAAALRSVSDRLFSRELNLPAWVLEMRKEIKSAFIAQYLSGRGGRSQMTPADYGRLGQMLKAQYALLDRFAAEIAAGKLTEAQIRARAALYAQSAAQAHERGKAAAWGITLPAHPKDGSTPCRANCKCSWSITERKDQIEARWLLRPAEHCGPCVERAGRWNPLTFPRDA